MVRGRAGVVVTLAVAAWNVGCGCPTVSGPTAPATAAQFTLASGQFQVFDVPTPSGTTQIDVTVSWIAGLAVWRVDPSCPAETATQCSRLTPGAPLAGPAQAQNISLRGGPVIGDTARFVVQNQTSAPVTVRLSLEPRRAGCT